jgi:hypothetical protein
MLAEHTSSFLRLIDTVLDDISRGVASGHHLHNVRCGIENILALLEYNNELVGKLISSHVEPLTASHPETWLRAKLETGRLRTLTACALLTRRLPVFALRLSTVGQTPGSARSD